MSASDWVRTEIDIAADPHAVWHALTDFPSYPTWNPYVVAVSGPLVPGATLAVRLAHTDGADPVDSRVLLVAATFPDMIWEGGHADRSIFKGDHRFRVEPLPDGTTIFRHVEHFSGSAAADLLARHHDAITASFQRFNRALKQLVEQA